MTTHLTLDDQLIQEALTIGGFKSKKEAVHAALKEFIERRKQQEAATQSIANGPTSILNRRTPTFPQARTKPFECSGELKLRAS